MLQRRFEAIANGHVELQNLVIGVAKIAGKLTTQYLCILQQHATARGFVRGMCVLPPTIGHHIL